MSNYNLPLLRKERDWVAEQRAMPWAESELAMAWWHVEHAQTLREMGKTCGTVYCVAGHIEATCGNVRGAGEHLVQWAAKQLGLTRTEACSIFYSADDEVLGVLDGIIAKAEAAEREEQ